MFLEIPKPVHPSLVFVNGSVPASQMPISHGISDDKLKRTHTPTHAELASAGEGKC